MTHMAPPSTLVAMSLLLLSTALLTQAHAAEPTDLPPKMTGDARLGYTFDQAWLPLEESQESVGDLTLQDQQLGLGATFTVIDGLAVFLEIPIHLRSRATFGDAQEMGWDPHGETGTLLTGNPLDPQPDAVNGTGVGGIWLGVKGTPLSENWGHRSTWLFEMALRTPDKTSFWAETDKGRGAGPGAAAFRFTTAFSTTRGIVQPYLIAQLLRQGTQEVGLDNGTADVEPGRSATFATGMEILAAEDAQRSSSFSMDFRAGFSYHSYAELPSGVYLPSVLSSSAGSLVTQGEYSTASAGLGATWQFMPELKANLHTGIEWRSPYRLEEPYPVYTGPRNLGMTAGLSFTYLYR